MSVIEEIAAERKRQIEVEGFSTERDRKEHSNHQLALAAAEYALNASGLSTFDSRQWPWSRYWWKPTNPRRDLIKAAALIVAEIERLDSLAK